MPEPWKAWNGETVPPSHRPLEEAGTAGLFHIPPALGCGLLNVRYLIVLEHYFHVFVDVDLLRP